MINFRKDRILGISFTSEWIIIYDNDERKKISTILQTHHDSRPMAKKTIVSSIPFYFNRVAHLPLAVVLWHVSNTRHRRFLDVRRPLHHQFPDMSSKSQRSAG